MFSNASDGTNTLIGLVYDIARRLRRREPRAAAVAGHVVGAVRGRPSLTLQLRDDVTFHSGASSPRKDVEFSIKTCADPAWTVQLQRTAAAITDFDTSDPHAITLTFDHPLSNIFDLLDMVPIVDERVLRPSSRTASEYVGTGAVHLRVAGRRAPSCPSPATRTTGTARRTSTASRSASSPTRKPRSPSSAPASSTPILGGSYRDLRSLEKAGDFDVQPATRAPRTQSTSAANVDAPRPQGRASCARRSPTRSTGSASSTTCSGGSATRSTCRGPKYSPAYDEQANATYDRDVGQGQGAGGRR